MLVRKLDVFFRCSCCLFLVFIDIGFTWVNDGILVFQMWLLDLVQLLRDIFLLVWVRFLLVSEVILLILGHMLLKALLPKNFVKMINLWNKVDPQFVKLFVVMADEFFLLRIKLIVRSVSAWNFVREWIHIAAQDLLQVFEGGQDFWLNLFWVHMRVIGEGMLKHGVRFRPVFWVVTYHLLKDVLEDSWRLHLAIDLPKVLLAFKCKLLVVRIVRVSPSEGLVFHLQQEKSGSSRKNVCLDTIVVQTFCGSQVRLSTLTSFAESVFNFPKFRGIVSDGTDTYVSLDDWLKSLTFAW